LALNDTTTTTTSAATATPWEPPASFEEKLRGLLIPPAIYYALRAKREVRRGEAELRILPFLVGSCRPAVDAGANKGVYTYWLERLSSRVPCL